MIDKVIVRVVQDKSNKEATESDKSKKRKGKQSGT
jgi:ribosome assembly protein YihI (activator of Der GTPase)